MLYLSRKIVLLASVVVLGCGAADAQGVPRDDSQADGGTGGAATSTATDPGGAGGAGGAGDDCPADVICVESLPFVDANTTTGAGATLDGYGCAPDVNEAGPEKVYRVDLAKPGLLVASLDKLGADVDVDVHILEKLDAGACVDRGHWDAVAALDAGQYWVVVDSWVNDSGISQEGDYELTIALNTADAFLDMGLDSTVLDAGLGAFAHAWASGDTDTLEYGIIDYTMPSTQPRFFVLDLRESQMLYAELTSHGEGSQAPGDLKMTGSMSNLEGSHASSVGLVITAETYSGKNGLSLRLDGLEVGFNDNDRSRAIVVHGADYATQKFVDANGYLGRSWGCPAIDPAVHKQLINTMADGRLLLKYFDDPDWLTSSVYVSP